MKQAETIQIKPETAAEAYAGALAARGVEYLFANGGTDFAPIVEAYAKGQALGWRLPQPVIVPQGFEGETEEEAELADKLGHELSQSSSAAASSTDFEHALGKVDAQLLDERQKQILQYSAPR